VARAAAVALAVLALAGAGAGASSAAVWGRPVRIAGPEQNSIVGRQLAFSDAGEAALAFSVQDEQQPAQSRAFTALRAAKGGFSRGSLSAAQLVLGLAFVRSDLYLLTGTAPSPFACCATVAVRRGLHGGARPLVAGLTGVTDGQLVALSGGQLLAAIATQRGLWTAQSDRHGTFAESLVRQLQFSGAPAGLAATAVRGGGGAVAWSDVQSSVQSDPRRILYAVGSARSAPSTARTAVSLPDGKAIDQLAIAPARVGATVAWVQSWYDASGAFHSAVMVHDLRGRPVVQASSGKVLASDLSFAGDAAGDQVLAWDACSPTGTCSVQASVRPAGGRFGTAQTLSASDPIEAPAAAISAFGKALVGWIRGGDVVAAAQGLHARQFGSARTVSRAGDDYDVSVGFAPSGAALLCWTQGAVAPELFVSGNSSP
jgi:hypothetical protein